MREGRVTLFSRKTQPVTFSEQTSMNLALVELSSMTEHRRVRQLESGSKLPQILWIVLIVGGILTILSACLFGTDNPRLQALQVFSLSLMLSLGLVAIADIDRPFQGVIHVVPQAFAHARDTFSQSPVETQ
jgi:hypothetical protein